MKRLGIIFGIFIVLVAAVAFVVSRRAPAGQPSPAPSPVETATPLPQPTFPDVSQFLQQPSYTMGAISDNFPKSLPVFTTQPSESIQTEISRLATLFHINSQPAVNSAIDGTYYMWSTDPGLIVGPNGQHVDYSATAPASSLLSEPDGTFAPLGQQLASTVTRWYPLQQTSTLYFAPANNDLNFVARGSGRAIQISFLPTLGGLPLVAGDPKLSETVIRYNAAKTLLYYSGYIYPKFTQTANMTPIISLQDAEARLVAGRGSILSANSSADINAHETNLYQFSLSTITGARLAYYYNFGSKQLSPVFLFTGTATDKNTKKQVDTVSAVSALP